MGCAVSVSQLQGCYSENPSCAAGDNSCRVTDYVSAATSAKQELSECAAACRLGNHVYFAKTVSMLRYRQLQGSRRRCHFHFYRVKPSVAQLCHAW